MHNNIEEFIAANQQHCSNSRACSENGKRFEIVSNERFTKVKIDAGVIASALVGKCDYGFFRHSNNEVYFVELKGKDLQTAYNQLQSTINIFEQQHLKTPKALRYGFIVSSKVPKAGTDVGNLKQRFARDFGKELQVKNNELKYPPK